MACSRCQADPQPGDFGSPRHCAFTPRGSFTDENWNCATLDVLIALARRIMNEDSSNYRAYEGYGFDEMVHLILCPDDIGGWLALTRYKRRGRTSSMVWIGDHAPKVPNLKVVEAIIEGLEKGRSET